MCTEFCLHVCLSIICMQCQAGQKKGSDPLQLE